MMSFSKSPMHYLVLMLYVVLYCTRLQSIGCSSSETHRAYHVLSPTYTLNHHIKSIRTLSAQRNVPVPELCKFISKRTKLLRTMQRHCITSATIFYDLSVTLTPITQRYSTYSTTLRRLAANTKTMARLCGLEAAREYLALVVPGGEIP